MNLKEYANNIGIDYRIALLQRQSGQIKFNIETTLIIDEKGNKKEIFNSFYS